MTTPTTTPTRTGPEGPARRRARRGRRLLAVSLLALAPLAAACGSGDSSASGSSGEAAAATNADTSEYLQCLSDNGVEMPDPGSGGQPPTAGESGTDQGGTPPEMPDQEAMQAAQEACADLAPEGGMPGPGGGGDNTEMQAYTDCLADNGVEVPEMGGGQPPTSGDTGDASAGSAPSSDGAPFGLDSSDPTVAAAIEACADLEPERPSAPPSDQATTTTEATATS